MGVFPKYNPSSGKLSFNSDTGKVQVLNIGGPGNTCNNCNPLTTPKYIRATFSGIELVQNNTCYNCDFPQRDVTWEGIPDVNREFIIPQDANCRWEGSFPMSLKRTTHDSDDGTCSGGVFSETTWDTLSVWVVLGATDIQVTMFANEDLPILEFFLTFIIPTQEEFCLNGTNENDWLESSPGCKSSSSFDISRVGWGGEVVLEDILP